MVIYIFNGYIKWILYIYIYIYIYNGFENTMFFVCVFKIIFYVTHY